MKSFSELTVEEVLDLAIGVAQTNSTRYRVWADQFRPYNDKVCSLLEELSLEEEMSTNRLKKIYMQRCGKSSKTPDPKRLEKIFKDDDTDQDHFFVVDDTQGKRILLDALKSEFESFVFFKQAGLNTKDASLSGLFDKLADYEEEHVREIKENLNDDGEKS